MTIKMYKSNKIISLRMTHRTKARAYAFNLCEQTSFIMKSSYHEVMFSTLKNSPFLLFQSRRLHMSPKSYSLPYS